MGSVSTYRIRAIQWYVAHQEEMAALRRRRLGAAEVAEEPLDPRQARIAQILRLRAEGKTQSDVAKAVGVSRQYVGNVERSILPAVMGYLASADLLEAAADILEIAIR